MGQVSRVVAPGQALASATALALRITMFPRQCMLADRRSAFEQWDLPLAEALRREGVQGVPMVRRKARPARRTWPPARDATTASATPYAPPSSRRIGRESQPLKIASRSTSSVVASSFMPLSMWSRCSSIRRSARAASRRATASMICECSSGRQLVEVGAS